MLFRSLYGSRFDSTIYKGLNMQVGSLSVRLLNGLNSLSFRTSIHADNMEPIEDSFRIIVTGTTAIFEIV